MQDQLLEPHEARLVAGQADEALELAGQQHEPEQRLALAAVELEHDADALVRDERERVRRVDRDRRQDGDRLLVEALAQELEVDLRQLGHVQHRDTLVAQQGGELVPAALLDAGQRPDALLDRGQRFHAASCRPAPTGGIGSCATSIRPDTRTM